MLSLLHKAGDEPVQAQRAVGFDFELTQPGQSGQRIDWLRRLVDAYDRVLDTPLRSVERAALPLALARQPLWWVGRWLALLDNEEVARRGFAEMAWDLEWALQLIREADRWQAAFA